MAERKTAPANPYQGKVPLRVYHTVVLGTRQLTPHMLRITIGGGELHEFVSAAPDQFITFIVPQPGRELPPLGREVNWEELRKLPDDMRPAARNYTVRYHRPEVGEIDVDFVLHGDSGPVARWANHAKTGDPVVVWGPRIAYQPTDAAAWQLLIGDETGLPAIGAILEALPVGARAHAIIEVADAAEEQPLPTVGAVEVTWLHRGATPTSESTAILDAVRGLTFPDGPRYIWGGGERRAMSAVRKHLIEERGIAAEAISILNYWKQGDDEH